MNMRNATCVGTQTSNIPNRVTLLFIPYTVPMGCFKCKAKRCDCCKNFLEEGSTSIKFQDEYFILENFSLALPI